jgi:hypothetical protein
MEFRFRKRLRLFPGAWINLSKSGASLSVGGHGLTANIGKGGIQETMGLPGLWSDLSHKAPTNRNQPQGGRPARNTDVAQARTLVLAVRRLAGIGGASFLLRHFCWRIVRFLLNDNAHWTLLALALSKARSLGWQTSLIASMPLSAENTRR